MDYDRTLFIQAFEGSRKVANVETIKDILAESLPAENEKVANVGELVSETLSPVIDPIANAGSSAISNIRKFWKHNAINIATGVAGAALAGSV